MVWSLSLGQLCFFLPTNSDKPLLCFNNTRRLFGGSWLTFFLPVDENLPACGHFRIFFAVSFPQNPARLCFYLFFTFFLWAMVPFRLSSTALPLPFLSPIFAGPANSYLRRSLAWFKRLGGLTPLCSGPNRRPAWTAPFGTFFTSSPRTMSRSLPVPGGTVSCPSIPYDPMAFFLSLGDTSFPLRAAFPRFCKITASPASPFCLIVRRHAFSSCQFP